MNTKLEFYLFYLYTFMSQIKTNVWCRRPPMLKFHSKIAIWRIQFCHSKYTIEIKLPLKTLTQIWLIKSSPNYKWQKNTRQELHELHPHKTKMLKKTVSQNIVVRQTPSPRTISADMQNTVLCNMILLCSRIPVATVNTKRLMSI